jgi:hypothetical protein
LFTTKGAFGTSAKVTNPDTGETYSLAGKRGSSLTFTGTGTNDRWDDGNWLYGDQHATNKNDAIVYDLILNGDTTHWKHLSGITYFSLGEGNNVLDLTARAGHAAYSWNVTAYGGSGDDVLWAGTGNATLSGEAGNDNLSGGARNDWLDSLSGDDRLSRAIWVRTRSCSRLAVATTRSSISRQARTRSMSRAGERTSPISSSTTTTAAIRP